MRNLTKKLMMMYEISDKEIQQMRERKIERLKERLEDSKR